MWCKLRVGWRAAYKPKWIKSRDTQVWFMHTIFKRWSAMRDLFKNMLILKRSITAAFLLTRIELDFEVDTLSLFFISLWRVIELHSEWEIIFGSSVVYAPTKCKSNFLSNCLEALLYQLLHSRAELQTLRIPFIPNCLGVQSIAQNIARVNTSGRRTIR